MTQHPHAASLLVVAAQLILWCHLGAKTISRLQGLETICMGPRSRRGDYSASMVDVYQRRYAVAHGQVLDDLALLKEPSKIYLPFISCRFLRGLALRLSWPPLPASINTRIWGHTRKGYRFPRHGPPHGKSGGTKERVWQDNMKVFVSNVSL